MEPEYREPSCLDRTHSEHVFGEVAAMWQRLRRKSQRDLIDLKFV